MRESNGGGGEKYAVVIHPEEQGGYWAEVPARPGGYAVGETLHDLLATIREGTPVKLD